MNFWESFMERLEDGTVIRDIIAVIVTFGVMFGLMTGASVPELISQVWLVIVGYYFAKDFTSARVVSRAQNGHYARQMSTGENGNGNGRASGSGSS